MSTPERREHFAQHLANVVRERHPDLAGEQVEKIVELVLKDEGESDHPIWFYSADTADTLLGDILFAAKRDHGEMFAPPPSAQAVYAAMVTAQAEHYQTAEAKMGLHRRLQALTPADRIAFAKANRLRINEACDPCDPRAAEVAARTASPKPTNWRTATSAAVDDEIERRHGVPVNQLDAVRHRTYSDAIRSEGAREVKAARRVVGETASLETVRELSPEEQITRFRAQQKLAKSA